MLEFLTLYDGVGLVGSVIVVGAYYLATRRILLAHKAPFNLINILGGALVMVSLLHRPNLGAIVIEVMFILIAILAIWRDLHRRN